MPLIAFFDPPSVLKESTRIFSEALEAAGLPPRRADIRIPRFVYVSDSVKKARAEIEASMGPILEGRKREFPYQFENLVPPGGTLDDVTFDRMVETGSIYIGDPDTVYRGLKALYDEVGGFGVLLQTLGKDAGTRRQRVRSLRLFMEEVAPRLASLNPDRVPAAAAV
jgi:alkanesulfonate monooxygenase SsuD/methylene tetrahydromethanopterin reductase-like flavin-dependent oxidoreductase (luciferase family)